MKTKNLILAFALALCTTFAFAQISGTLHDFAQTGGFNDGGEICITCHTPHDSDISVTNAPLWNHEVTAELAYTLYASTTLNATLGQPLGNSKLCLSCHDGTVALDSYGGATGVTTIGTGGLIGTNLSTEHPISFDYDAAQALDLGIRVSTSTVSMPVSGTGTIAADLLFGGQMECATCHDVHNGEGIAKLLRVDNTGSLLCLTCHNK